MPFREGQSKREEPEPRQHRSSADYILGTGEAAASRLEMLDGIFGPHSRQLLEKAGLAKGMRVADIGCGTGLVSLWLATKVGTEGAVVGVDMSSDQLRIAEQNAVAAGLANISFHRASACETNLPRAHFDLVYSRFLMCHLTEPDKALREMRALLKPDATLVCEDYDDGGIFSEPQTRAYKRLVEISDALDRIRGLDSRVGLKLPQLMRKAGFLRPEIMVKQIAELRGSNKRFWELTLREATQAILAAGVATQEELDTIRSELRAVAADETTLVMLARVTQVWARCGSTATAPIRA